MYYLYLFAVNVLHCETVDLFFGTTVSFAITVIGVYLCSFPESKVIQRKDKSYFLVISLIC